MKQVLAFVLLLAIVQGLMAQGVPPTGPSEPSGRSDVVALRSGQVVTLILVSGKNVRGSVIAQTGDSVQLRVKHSFFRYRMETYPVADIVSVKKHMPAWVGPVVMLGILGGAVIGVAACVASGACLN